MYHYKIPVETVDELPVETLNKLNAGLGEVLYFMESGKRKVNTSKTITFSNFADANEYMRQQEANK